MRRFMASANGVITLAAAMIVATFALLGPEAGWRLAVLLGAVGIVDLVLGALGGTLSEAVNRVYHRNRWLYWLWVLVLSLLLVFGLNAHFTGV